MINEPSPVVPPAPMPVPSPPPCPNGTLYTIQTGDTLYSLARRNNTTVAAIEAANPGIMPTSLQVGRIICLPGVAPPPPISCPNGALYTIQVGDNFYAIARHYNISLDYLLAANPGMNPDRLQIGQQICIPAPTPTITCPGATYTIRAGDTIYSIGHTLGFSVNAILAANPSINPNTLQVGQIICLPTGGTVPCPNGTIYRVKPGDTLYGIARNFDITLARLLDANPGLTETTIIHPNQAICIPIREI